MPLTKSQVKHLLHPNEMLMASVMLFAWAGLIDGRTIFQVNEITEASRNWTLFVKSSPSS